jgi:hypothetical protein
LRKGENFVKRGRFYKGGETFYKGKEILIKGENIFEKEKTFKRNPKGENYFSFLKNKVFLKTENSPPLLMQSNYQLGKSILLRGSILIGGEILMFCIFTLTLNDYMTNCTDEPREGKIFVCHYFR